MDLRLVLRTELERRRGRNPQYSLRAFAQKLGTHHSTLSQLLERRRRLTPRAIHSLGKRLGLRPAEIADACLHENASEILRLVADERFQPNSRWIATMLGLPLDEVNRALHWLIFQRRLTMQSPTRWVGEKCS